MLLLCGSLLTDTRADEKAASEKQLLLCEGESETKCVPVIVSAVSGPSPSKGAKQINVFLFVSQDAGGFLHPGEYHKKYPQNDKQGQERGTRGEKERNKHTNKEQCRLNYVCYQHNEKCLY